MNRGHSWHLWLTRVSPRFNGHDDGRWGGPVAKLQGLAFDKRHIRRDVEFSLLHKDVMMFISRDDGS